jgi:hypothetical protein
MHRNAMHALRSSKSEAGPCYAEASHGTANILNIYILRARESKGGHLNPLNPRHPRQKMSSGLLHKNS